MAVPGSPKHRGPLPALNSAMTLGSATAHKRATAWTPVTAAAFLLYVIRVCFACMHCPCPVLLSPLISQWLGGDILSDQPFKHTHFLFTPATSSLGRKLPQRQITSGPRTEERCGNERRKKNKRKIKQCKAEVGKNNNVETDTHFDSYFHNKAAA